MKKIGLLAALAAVLLYAAPAAAHFLWLNINEGTTKVESALPLLRMGPSFSQVREIRSGPDQEP